MYSSFYGLTFNPFDKQQLKEKDHFISRDFTEMTNWLNYLKDIRGIGVFTARPGMGKSYALRCFAASLNPSLFHMEYLCLSTISVADFYKQLCFILGVPEKRRQNRDIQGYPGTDHPSLQRETPAASSRH